MNFFPDYVPIYMFFMISIIYVLINFVNFIYGSASVHCHLKNYIIPKIIFSFGLIYSNILWGNLEILSGNSQNIINWYVKNTI